MNRFLKSLLSGDQHGVDSTIVCGIASLLVFFALSGYAIGRDWSYFGTPSAWLGWGGAVSLIIGIVTGAKTAHSRWSSGAQTATVVSPPDTVAQIETKP